MHRSSCPKIPQKVLRLLVSTEAVGYHTISSQWEDPQAKHGNANPAPTEFQHGKSAEDCKKWISGAKRCPKQQLCRRGVCRSQQTMPTPVAVNILLKQNTSRTQCSLHGEALQGHGAKPCSQAPELCVGCCVPRHGDGQPRLSSVAELDKRCPVRT